MMLRLKGILILILLKLCEKCGFTNGWICSTIVTYYAFILGGLLYNVDCRWMERLKETSYFIITAKKRRDKKAKAHR